MSDGAIGSGPMSPDDWRVLGPLLDAALDAPPEERSSFIAALCHGDEEKAAVLRRLVEECEQGDQLLDGTATDRFAWLLDEEAPPEFPSMLAGRYRVEREIGRGGMAVVFLARDLTHDRPVAVKVMRESGGARLGAARFLAEIRVTAGLRHPHIVPLYDSGASDDSLYFVMPYYEEGTLAARLGREHRLSSKDALRIAGNVAAALEHAHAAGLVHRDIKPSNILFSSGHALLADFGIARAGRRTQPDLTSTGIAIGTPNYMSPEQSAGDRSVDARSDIYSLGCVLYEMLSGEPPLPSGARAALGRHAVDVPSLRASQPDVSPVVEACVSRAMALDPAERFASAADFAQALADCANSGPVPATRPRPRIRWRWAGAMAVAGVALVVATAWGVIRARSPARAQTSRAGSVAELLRQLDSSRYVLLPYDYGSDVKLRLDVPDLMGEAIAAWQGVSVVDHFQVADALTNYAIRPLRAADAREVALGLHAGRYVRRELSQRSGTLVVHTSVFDTRTGESLVERTNPLPNGSRLDSVFASLAAQTLFAGVSLEDSSTSDIGTRSRPALQAFLKGRQAVEEWDLERADSDFAAASAFDPAFPQAHLWVAQVREWRSLPAATWQFEVRRALAQRTRLSARDQRAADVLDTYAGGDTNRACGLWSHVPSGARDFAAWYGSAMCQYRDNVVVRDPTSRSSWRFRASFHTAAEAFRRAYQVLPSTYREFREDWYWDLGMRLHTQWSTLRAGHAAAPDTGHFAAYPSWSESGDTIEFVPYPLADFALGKPWTLPPSRGKAVRRQRALFRDIATTWRAAFPRSADALLALAVALDEQGDRSALDSVRAARRLATDADQRLRAGAAEVWLRVKLGVPSDVASLRAARLLADSLIRAYPNARGREAGALASLAVLDGHAFAAAALARRDVGSDLVGSGAVKLPAQALLTFAAVGGPEDSLRVLEGRVSAAIRAIEPAAQPGLRAQWLARPMTLAFPSYRGRWIHELGATDVLAATEDALLSGDTARVRRVLRDLHDRRSGTAPENLKLEAVYPESWLLDALGDPDAAIGRLAPTLDAQSSADAETLSNVAGAGALIRAMMLRAELASRKGDTSGAALWARAVTTLWAEADPFLQQVVVQPMARLAR